MAKAIAAFFRHRRMLGSRWQSYQANQIMQASAEYDALIYTTNKDAAAQQAKVAEFVESSMIKPAMRYLAY